MRDEENACGNCGYYFKNIIKFLISHIGLVSLVIGYTIIGAFTFERLESDHEIRVKQNMSNVRKDVTDDLWGITDHMEVLNESIWAAEVRQRLKDFEKSLIKAIKTDGWDGSEDTTKQQWTFAGALFYSIILITTIGYGHIAPKTDWGKVITIIYAIPGVPLMMLCLANIGDGMAHSFRFLYWKVCCYACTKRPKKKRRVRHMRGSTRRYPSQQGSGRIRSSSFRRSNRASEKSADSHLSDSAFYTSSYSEPEYKMYDDMVDADMRGLQRNRPSDRSHHTRSSQNSKGSDHLTPPPKEGLQDDGRVAVLFNKYALETEGLPADNGHMVTESDRDVEGRPERESKRSKRDEDPDLPVIHQPRGPRTVSGGGYLDSPQMSRSPRSSERYSRHLPPPADPRSRLSRLDEEYYDDYEDEYDDEEEEDFVGDKPVPIWLGVMLVVAYILGGAALFSGWEGWGFLDSIYFCFITLTTIGFGDFVPSQNINEDVELSIALCSIYLLFGIALLAMSFNLVQEEVISNIKTMARRLGILKEDEDEDD
ncbi:potassium channel subfamily K member 18 isoform X1 [Macrobrachium rosenbergii]|uniref:potassium channel subfamily K member 18 isoform X1 n=1 Tax=Macrobrachium rosenbergii TaxID=79674 RepID=UPI0034D3E969